MSSPDSPACLSVVVLSWNTRALTLACLDALAADRSARPREIIVVDNGSEDGSAAAVEAAHPGVVLIRNACNTGYSAGNNQGARRARGRWLCLLNSDTEVQPGALDTVASFLEQHPGHGAAAPKLLNSDGSVQRACMRFPGLGVALCHDSIFGRLWPGSWVQRRYYMRDFDHLRSCDVDQPPGACFVIARAEYLELGGLDPRLWLFFNDVDLCRRLWKRGRKIRYVAEAEVVHHGGSSTSQYGQFAVTWFRNRIAYYRKHYGPLAVPLLRAVVRLRAFEETRKAHQRYPDSESVRSERAYIKRCVAEILAP